MCVIGAPCTIPSSVTSQIQDLFNRLSQLSNSVNTAITLDITNQQAITVLQTNVNITNQVITNWMANATSSIQNVETELELLLLERALWCEEARNNYVNTINLKVQEIHAYNQTQPLYMGTHEIQFQTPNPSITNTFGDITLCPASRNLNLCATSIVAQNALTLVSTTGAITLSPNSTEVIVQGNTISLGYGLSVFVFVFYCISLTHTLSVFLFIRRVVHLGYFKCAGYFYYEPCYQS